MIGYGTHNQPEGTWSDDTSMTIATCMSIKNKACVDTDDIRKEFENWMFNIKKIHSYHIISVTEIEENKQVLKYTEDDV